jgi:hypothetical protein
LQIATGPRGLRALGWDYEACFNHHLITAWTRLWLLLQDDTVPGTTEGKGTWICSHAPFGCRTTGGISGQYVDCTSDIIENRFPAVKTYSHVDDCLAIAQTEEAPPKDDIFALVRRLGWRIHDVKHFDWSLVFEHRGLEWDLTDLTIKLLPRKQQKYLAKIARYLERGTASRDDLDSLIGSLVYVTSVRFDLNAQLAALINWRSSISRISDVFAQHKMTAPARACLAVWSRVLGGPEVKSSFARPPSPSRRLLYSDASDEALGILVVDKHSRRRALAWRLHKGWKANGRDIGVAESWAFELICRAAVQLSDQPQTHLVFIDIKGVDDAWKKGRSCSVATNETFKRIFTLSNETGHLFDSEWLPTDENLADCISRGGFGDVEWLQIDVTLPHAVQRWASSTQTSWS